MAYAATLGRRRKRSGGLIGRILVTFAGLVAAGLVAAPVAYMLWPVDAPLTPDAPSIPVTIGGVAFNVPPAAIRFKLQRKSGTHPRIDMTFVWPSMTPPDPAIKPQPTDTPDVTDRMFVTIAASDSTLAPMERLKTIYPRYLDAAPIVSTDGLSTQVFRDGTAYQGEDLVLDPSRLEQFLLRCTRITGLTPAMCLHERRIGGADITVRFPRDWLSDWRTVSDAIERLVAGFKPQV
jgi:hypothetical protein